MKIHLLHCRTSAIEHCRFGFLRLEQAVEAVEQAILGAFSSPEGSAGP